MRFKSTNLTSDEEYANKR